MYIYRMLSLVAPREKINFLSFGKNFGAWLDPTEKE